MSETQIPENTAGQTNPQGRVSFPGDRALLRVTDFLGYLGGAGVILMMLHVVADVAMRFIFNHPVPATLEISQFWYMPMVIFLGLAVAERTDQHISAPIVYDRLTPRLKYEMTVISTVLSVLLLAGMSWFGLEEAMTLMQQEAKGIGSGVAIWPTRFLVPIGCTMFALELISRLVRSTIEYRQTTRKESAE